MSGEKRGLIGSSVSKVDGDHDGAHSARAVRRSKNSAQYGHWQLRNFEGETGEVLSGRCQPIQSYSKKPLLLLRIIDHLSGAGRQINGKNKK